MDVFESNLRMRNRVIVAGSGPNGLHQGAIFPGDADIIAVNKAMALPGIQPNYWVCMDVHQAEKPWWKSFYWACKNYALYTTFIFDQRYVQMGYYADYTFTVPGTLNHNDCAVKPGELRIGATVAGIAVQLAWHLGAKEILLYGVDMSGSKYFDGTEAEHHKDGEWKCLNRFKGMIDFIESNSDTRIYTLTDTAIEVRKYERMG